MISLHITAPYNVEPSINMAYEEAVNNFIELPDWMPTPTVVYNWPEIQASTPCFSIIHFTGSSVDRYQGRVETHTTTAMHNTGLLEISAWVSRDQKYNGLDVWAARLRYMKSMIQQIHSSLSTVQIYDFENDANAPTPAPYRVLMKDMNEVQTAKDPNPSIERKRFLINYSWHLRGYA